MNVSGTLHFYSGEDKELFFVFDDDVAQEMYVNEAFDIDDAKSRRVYISVGDIRFIHERTLSFSRKQTEIKVSLCSRNTKEDLGPLTALYDWFAHQGAHPSPFGLLGHLAQVQHNGTTTWELAVTEPENLVVPPGLPARLKKKSGVRRSYDHRREVRQADLTVQGRLAERVALRILAADFAAPDYKCLWRDKYLDSEQVEIRRLGIIADIDIWNVRSNAPELFVEVKAQKSVRSQSEPVFHLSAAEWRSYQSARAEGIGYEVWLFQYSDLEHLRIEPHQVKLIIFDQLSPDWLDPEGYYVTPPSDAGKRRKLV